MVEKENQTSLECFDGISGVKEGQEHIVLEFTDPLKKCIKCGEWLDKSKFPTKALWWGSGKKYSICKACNREYDKNITQNMVENII